VFRKFNHSKTIELACPYCGHRQQEPARVISSFCRECSEHFRVQKGVAIPNPGMRISGISEVGTPQSKPESSNLPEENNALIADPQKEDAWLMSAEDDAEVARPLPREEEGEEEVADAISAGAFFGLVDPEGEQLDGKDAEEKGIGEKAQGKETLAEGSMAALIDNQPPTVPEKGKMPPNYKEPEKRKQAGDHSRDLEVRCFRCYHIQHVSRFAKSTQCERCSVYISLANYEITSNKSLTLRTRGDITIAKRGGLKKCEVACHNLTAHGTIDAFVDCSGLAVFRRSGVVRGHLHCRKIVVEKTASLEFPDGLFTEQADVQGQVKGDITCSGTVRIAKGAEVEGNIRAVSIDLKEGGSVHGETLVDPEVSTALQVKVGFNPSVIG